MTKHIVYLRYPYSWRDDSVNKFDTSEEAETFAKEIFSRAYKHGENYTEVWIGTIEEYSGE